MLAENASYYSEKPPGLTAEKVFEWVVLGVTFIVTIWAAWFIYKRMAKVRPLVIAEREYVRLYPYSDRSADDHQ